MLNWNQDRDIREERNMELTEKIFLTIGIALIVSLVVGPFLIPALRVLKFGQSIRDDGPQRHLAKAGTPTIGGLIFLCGIVVSVLIMAEKPYSAGLLSLLGITLAFCYSRVLG